MGKKNRKENIETEFVEIQDGELYLRIPKKVLNRELEKVSRILLAFNEPELPVMPMPELEEEELPLPAEPQIDEFMTHCPKCNSKVKSKVKKRGNELIRIVRCKKSKGFRKKCDFIHEFSIKV